MVLFSQRRPREVPDQSRTVLLAATVAVNVPAIAANHDPVDGKLVGKHDWVIRFLRGVRRLNPPRPPSIPSWDLSLVLRALQQGPFEPCKQSSWSFSQNENSTPACTKLHQEGWGLHAFSVDDSCLKFGPVDSQIILRPRSSYVPKVSTPPFGDQVVSLRVLPPEEADPAQALLVPSEYWHATLTGREASGPQTNSCLLRRPAERECRLQAEDGPLDSGCHHRGLSGTGCALPVQVESPLYKKCGVLLGACSWHLADRYL